MLNCVTGGYCLSSSSLAFYLEFYLAISLLGFFLCYKLTFSWGDDWNHIKHYTGNSSQSHTPDRRNPDSDFRRNISGSMLSKRLGLSKSALCGICKIWDIREV